LSFADRGRAAKGSKVADPLAHRHVERLGDGRGSLLKASVVRRSPVGETVGGSRTQIRFPMPAFTPGLITPLLPYGDA